LNLYLANEKFKNDFVLDISTHIILECIKSYLKTGSFIFESDYIFKDLKNNGTRKFQIGHYFERCLGRTIPHWNQKNVNGKIEKISFEREGQVRFYYAIEISTKNNNFNYLKEEVKKIPGRKWNKEKKHWGVPSRHQDEVYEFAKKHRFAFDLPDKKHKTNNLHLVTYSRGSVPKGIKYCEGRKTNKEHNFFQKEFWWCLNQACFENAITDHLTEKFTATKEKDIWEHYTLLDMLRILEVNLDEYNGYDMIKDGKYYVFLGHINAFNRLLAHLYCKECDNLLYPKGSSHFALYRDTRFYCMEEGCSAKEKEIYLTTCLYGECKEIIDSRISKQCEHGLFICKNCGSCCSHESFTKRLNNLESVGGYIHRRLRESVAKKHGHLEKKEYYCYKCLGMMTEINTNKFSCDICNVIYDFNQFKWLRKKWTRIEERREDYPKTEAKDNDFNKPSS